VDISLHHKITYYSIKMDASDKAEAAIQTEDIILWSVLLWRIIVSYSDILFSFSRIFFVFSFILFFLGFIGPYKIS